MNYSFLTYLAVGLGGGLGAILRMGLAGLVDVHFVSSRHAVFPLGTIVVNVSGCLVIGFLHSLVQPDGRFVMDPLWRQFLFVGILGGYTTFSSFSLQTLTLFQDGEWMYASLNVFVSVVLCLIGVWLGAVSGQLLNNWR